MLLQRDAVVQEVEANRNKSRNSGKPHASEKSEVRLMFCGTNAPLCD